MSDALSNALIYLSSDDFNIHHLDMCCDDICPIDYYIQTFPTIYLQINVYASKNTCHVLFHNLSDNPKVLPHTKVICYRNMLSQIGQNHVKKLEEHPTNEDLVTIYFH